MYVGRGQQTAPTGLRIRAGVFLKSPQTALSPVREKAIAISSRDGVSSIRSSSPSTYSRWHARPLPPCGSEACSNDVRTPTRRSSRYSRRWSDSATHHCRPSRSGRSGFVCLRAGPMVRILFPPARSLRTISSEAAKPPLPFSKPLDPIYESDRACNGMIFDIDNFLVVATEPLDLVPSFIGCGYGDRSGLGAGASDPVAHRIR
jgi:hypothetical protein